MALTDNLVSYWKLDESSGNAADSVGSNTLTNTGTTSYGAAKINNGAIFSRASGTHKLAIADASQTGLDFSTTLSFSLWAKFASDTGDQMRMVRKIGNSGEFAYDFYYDASGNTLACRFSGNGTSLTTTASGSWTPTNGTWYHLVLTYSAGAVNFYVNGSLLTSTTNAVTSIYNGAATFTLGNSDDLSAEFDGMLDEVGVWSRALSANEVSKLYNGGIGSQYTFTNVGIAFDKGGYDATADVNTHTVSLAAAEANEVAIIFITTANANLTSVTVGGSNATSLGAISNVYTSEKAFAYYFYNPPTSATNYVITCVSADLDKTDIVLYSGAASSQPDGITSHTGTGSESSMTLTINVGTVNSWLVGFCQDGNPPSAGAGLTPRVAITTSLMGDSNLRESTGNQSMTWNHKTSGYIGGAMISLKPYVAPAGPANLKTYNTNVAANIKTINTNVIANVKTLNTNA